MLDRHLGISYVDFIFEDLQYDLEAPLYFDASNPERNLSVAQIKSMISKVVAGLKHHGLKKGDSVCVMSLNDIYYTPLYLGIMASGGIFTGANPGYKVFETVHHLRVCEAKFLITGLQSFETAKQAAQEVGIPESNVFVFNPNHEDIPQNAKSFWDLMTHGEAAWGSVSDAAATPCAYISSSGTSGLPKAVVVPHAYMTAQCAIQTDRNLSYTVRRLLCLPPFPGYVAPSQHGAPIKAGNKIYVMPRYDANLFIEAVEKHQITETLFVPPMLLSLPKAPNFTREAMSSLRQVFCGGAHIGNGVQQEMYAVLHPDARINQIYGMTEAGWVCGFQHPEKDDTGSVGRPLEGFQVKIVDDDGLEITTPGQQGELYIKPPFPMLGYLNNPTATAAALAPDGWVRSGDIGRRTVSGKCYVSDRKKDIIKVRGWQVCPAELEAVLLLHHDVVDAAVVRATYGGVEAPRAYVVRREGARCTAQEVRQFVAARLARFKVPEEVVFVAAIPRNPTGKILRRVLEEGIPVEVEVENEAEGWAGQAGLLPDARLPEGSIAMRVAM